MVQLNLIITIITVIFNLVVGFYVWWVNKKQPNNRFFFLFALLTGFWIAFNHLAYVVTTDQLALLFVRLAMGVTAPLPLLIYYFALTFPNHKLQISWPRRLLYDALMITSLVIALTPLVFSSVRVVGEGLLFTSAPGWVVTDFLIIIPGIYWYGFNILFFVSLALYHFYTNAAKIKGLVKTRFNFLFSSFALGIISICLCNFFLVVAFDNDDFIIVGTSLMSFFFIGGVGLALLKNRFSRLDFALAKIIYYLTLVAWVILPFYDFVNLHLVLDHWSFYLGLPLFCAWAYLLIQIFTRFDQYLIKLIVNHGVNWTTDKDALMEKIAKELDPQIILQATLEFFTSLIKTTTIQVIFNDDTQINKTRTTTAINEIFSAYQQYFATTTPATVIFEESHKIKTPGGHRLIKLMARHRIMAIFPIIIYDELPGVIIFGPKLNFSPFYTQDIELVEQTLADIAPLLNRALIYQDSQNFNQVLQQRIDRATAKLRRTNEKLIEADRLKDEFVSVASHELRTPMTAIKNYLWLMNKNQTESQAKMNKRYLQIAINSTERLINLVNDMLTISRLEGDRFATNPQPVDLNELLQRVRVDLLPLAKEKHLTLKLNLPPRPVTLNLDRDKILEVMHNLVGNSVKFTRQGGVTIAYRQNSKYHYLDVIDTGVGISDEDKKKMFRKFSRLEKSYVKMQETGTGLGLYISREIMRRHQGDITFESTLGRGSTFTLVFPKRQSQR